MGSKGVGWVIFWYFDATLCWLHLHSAITSQVGSVPKATKFKPWEICSLPDASQSHRIAQLLQLIALAQLLCSAPLSLSVLINRSQNLTGILMSHLFWIHSQCLGNNATSCQKHICNPSTFSFYHLNKLQGPEIGFVLLKLKVTPPRAKVADYLVDRQYRA